MQENEPQIIKNIPLYIINISERIDKEIEIQTQLNKMNYTDYEIYQGYDKNDSEVQTEYDRYNREYDNDDIKTTYYKSKSKSKVIKSISAIGLIKSTIELFKYIENKGLDYIIICEDDVCFHVLFQSMLKSINNMIDNYELLYIGYNSYNRNTNNLLRYNNNDIIVTIPHDRSLGPFYGTYGYICNSTFRKKIIEKGIKWFINNNATIDYGFNIMNWENEIKSGVVTGEHFVYPCIDDPYGINGIRKDRDTFYTLRNIDILNYVKRIEENIKFVFIVPSYNNELWIQKNIESILNQNYNNWRIIYINDASTDTTEDKFFNLTQNYQDKIIYIKNDINYGQAFNRYTAYNMCSDEEFCIMLDGDDWLASNFVLKYLNIFIQENNVDLTYGTCSQYFEGKIEKINWIPCDYSKETIDNKTYRKDIWRAMHLRVIKGEYLKKISPLDFLMPNNEFIICGTDMVESYPSLELSKGRHKKILKNLMIYNRENSLLYSSSFFNKNLERDKKDYILKKIKERSPYHTLKQNKKLTIINIENEHYKHMIQYYKEKLIENTDLFLVRNSLLNYYTDKLDKYDEIIDINEKDIDLYLK